MIEVELSDGTIAEFPDGMSPGDIKSALQRKFPAQPAGDLSSVLNQQPLEIPYSPGMQYGTPPPSAAPETTSILGEAWREIPEAIGEAAHTVLNPIGKVAAPIQGYAPIGLAASIRQTCRWCSSSGSHHRAHV